MRPAEPADCVHVATMVLRFITLFAAGVQLAYWIGALWQWTVGAEGPHVEGAKLLHRP
jgi:hypothetical protein